MRRKFNNDNYSNYAESVTLMNENIILNVIYILGLFHYSIICFKFNMVLMVEYNNL